MLQDGGSDAKKKASQIVENRAGLDTYLAMFKTCDWSGRSGVPRAVRSLCFKPWERYVGRAPGTLHGTRSALPVVRIGI